MSLRYIQKRSTINNLPPLLGFTSWIQNAKVLTSRNSFAAFEYLQNLSISIQGLGKTKYGSVFRIVLTPIAKYYIIISDYKLARIVLEGDNSRNIPAGNKTALSKSFDIFPGVGSLFSSSTDDPQRKAARKFLAPSFSMKNMQYTFDIVFKKLVQANKIFEDACNANAEIDISKTILKIVFDVICEAAFDINWDTLNSADSDGNKFLDSLDFALIEGTKRAFNPLRKYQFWLPENVQLKNAQQTIVKLLENMIDQYRQKNMHRSDIDNTIMGHIMRHNYPDDRYRVAEIVTFLTAGHETTAHSINFLLVTLAKSPECKRKLQEELDRNISSESRYDYKSFLGISELKSLTYLSCCIDETMRLYPAGASGSKRSAPIDFEYEGMTIPKGAICAASFYTIFRQPWIERADEFIPERFEKDAPQYKELREMLTPFSIGERNCIGQNLAKIELLMMCAYIVRFFDFELIEEPEVDFFLTLKVGKAIMKLRKRN